MYETVAYHLLIRENITPIGDGNSTVQPCSCANLKAWVHKREYNSDRRRKLISVNKLQKYGDLKYKREYNSDRRRKL